MHDVARDMDLDDEMELRGKLDADELITAAVAEAKRHARRNELKTNSALDAMSDWIEKSESRRSEETKRIAAKTETAFSTISDWISQSEQQRAEETKRISAKTDTALDAISEWIEKSESLRAEETKRLATSQERVASAVRDALGLMTGRLNQIESLVAEAPARAFEPIRTALGRLDDRVNAIEGQRGADERSSQQFSVMMDSLGQRLKDVVGKIDELADTRNRNDPSLREERIAGIESKLGTILQQLSRPSLLGAADTSSVPFESAPPIPPRARPRVVLRSVTTSGKLDAAVADIRRKQDELGMAQPAPLSDHPALRREADGGFSLSSLRAELAELAEQLQRLEKGRIDPEAFNELLITTSEVRRLLADPTMPKLAARIEQSVAELTIRVDALTTKAVDRSEIAALASTISDISTKLAEPRSVTDSTVVEKRIDALSAKIDEVMREPLGLVGQHLADLSARLGQQTPPDVPNIAFTEIRDKLDRIVERAEAPASGGYAPSFDNGALEEVRERLDRLSAKIEAAPSARDSGSIADLRERLDNLASSIERSATNAAPEKIDRVLRQIAANMDAARQSDPNLGMLQALERQVATLAERVGGEPASSTALAELDRSVSRLFAELADTKAAAIKAAEAAASQAVEAGDVTHQERLAEGREMHSTLDQMNQTLERIMGRLSSLEEQTRQAAPASHGDSLTQLIGAERAAEPSQRGAVRAPARQPDTELEAPLGSRAMPRPAPGAAERLPADDKPAAEPVLEPLVPSHEPLEPGSGRPQPGAALSRPPSAAPASSNGARPPLAGEAIAVAGSGSATSAQALIAAARRAAADTAARQNGAASTASPAGAAKHALSSLKTSAGQHRKPILLALIGLMVAFSAIGAGRLILGGDFPFGGEQPPPVSPRPSPPAPDGASGAAKPAQGGAPGAAQPAGPAPLPAAGRPSGSAAPQAPASPRAGMAAPAEDAAALAIPAREVVASIARGAPAPAKPGAAMASASPAPDAASSPDFIARLKTAANANDPVAEYELAAILFDGRGVPRDPQGAAKLFERAANQGLVPAQYRLANIYETGIGASKDLALAKSWFEKAADRGNAKAMHNVGVYLAQGIQGKPDYATAVTWFKKAADRNVRDSQYNLAILFARGLGATRDLKASYVWFALAAREGDADSAKKRDEIATRLTTAELDDAKAAVASWKPIELDRAANEVDVKDIKWDRVAPAATAPAADPPKKMNL